jgi:hypothetical protein
MTWASTFFWCASPFPYRCGRGPRSASRSRRIRTTSAHTAVSAVTPGLKGYGCVAVGAAFVARWVDDVRRTAQEAQEALDTREAQAGCSGEGDSCGALTICGDQLGDIALIEGLHRRFALGLGAQGGSGLERRIEAIRRALP